MPDLTLAKAGLRLGGTGRWTLVTDTDSGSTTYATDGDVYGQLSGQVGPAAGELKGVLGSSTAITRGEDGQTPGPAWPPPGRAGRPGRPTRARADLGGNASDASASSDVTVTTTTLDVATPDQRDFVDAWLAARADPEAAVSPQTIFPDRMAGLATLALPPASAGPPVRGSMLSGLLLVAVQSGVAGTLWRLRSH